VETKRFLWKIPVYLAAANGYLNSLDPHSAVFPSEAWKDQMEKIADSSFTGIGAILTGGGNKEVLVENPLDEYPAVKAGVRAGDVIVSVDGKSNKGVPLDKVDSEMRRRAKIINFGILYGMGVNALRQNLGTDRKEAQEFYNNYFATFSGLAKYLDEVKAQAERNGYTETFFGRRRYFEGINSKIPFIKAMAERMAINAPFQGTNADIIKIAMKKVYDFINQNGYEKDVFLVLQVHDELVYEVRESVASKVVPEIKNIMENIIPLKETKGVKLIVAEEMGDNWGELK
jgi:DNA polymerase-1